MLCPSPLLSYPKGPPWQVNWEGVPPGVTTMTPVTSGPKTSEHGVTLAPLSCAKTGAAEAAIMAAMMAITESTERSAMMRLIDATSFPSQPSWAALPQQSNSPSTGQPGRRRVVFHRIPLPPFPAAASSGSCHGGNLSASCLASLSTS